MNHNVGQCVRSRRPTLPPISNRTLHHPSFLPLYMAADFPHHHTDCNNQTIHPIIPAEFFYSDPTMSCGRRIPNIVSELRVFDCFQLNTPPPVMSACPAPPTRPDPFRSGPQPTRDLGSLTFKVNPLLPPVQPCRLVLQLSQEEDQAITNLLKLHHQEPLQSDETIIAPQMDLNPIPVLHHPELVDSTSAEEVYKPDVQRSGEASFRDQLQQRRCWSYMELEAANTLLSCFSLTEKDNIRGQNHNKSAATLPDPLPYPSQGSGEPGWGGFGFVHGRNADDVHMPVREEYLASPLPLRLPSDSMAKSRSSVSGDFSEVKERTLSDSEGDAVHVLLSLGDMGALDSMQSLS